MWRPIQEQHAILVMAAVLQFSEPLPQRSLRRVVAAAEDAAFSLGLRSRHRTTGVQLSIGSDLASPKVETPAEGYVFNSMSRAGDGEAPDQLSEQLLIDSNRILYRTMFYTSWEAVVARLGSLFAPPAAIALDAVAPQAYRLEYLDRFWFDGNPDDALAEDLFQQSSRYLPQHIFGNHEQWHVHTGSFTPAGQILQINADCVDRKDIAEAQSGTARSVDLVTALEQRYTSDEAKDDLTSPKMMDGLNGMHRDLKVILQELISNNMSEAIHLSGQQE